MANVVEKALVEKALVVVAILEVAANVVKRVAEANLKLVNIIKQVCFLVCYRVAEEGPPC